MDSRYQGQCAGTMQWGLLGVRRGVEAEDFAVGGAVNEIAVAGIGLDLDAQVRARRRL